MAHRVRDTGTILRRNSKSIDVNTEKNKHPRRTDTRLEPKEDSLQGATILLSVRGTLQATHYILVTPFESSHSGNETW